MSVRKDFMFTQADLPAVLHSIPWFLDLSSSQMGKLAGTASFSEVEAGEILFHEGEKEDYLYILLEGQMALAMQVPSFGSVQIFTAEPLDVIGWSSMTPVVRQRTCTARATQYTHLVRFQADKLKKVCEEDHDLGFIIMKRISNVVASRLLTTRLNLLENIANLETTNHHNLVLE